MGLISRLFKGELQEDGKGAPARNRPPESKDPVCATAMGVPSDSPPDFSSAWCVTPVRVSVPPRWLRSITDIPGIVIDDGVPWPRPNGQYPESLDAGDVEQPDWEGGRSPVSRWREENDFSPLSAADLATELRSGLSRPGTPSDYHFVISHFIALAFGRRAQDPFAVAWTEWFCWLHIRFVESIPTVLSLWHEDDHPAYVEGFSTLAQIYEREGMLEDASAVAARAKKSNAWVNTEQLDERLAALRLEDADRAPDR
jgi:hypothetical protein